MSGYVLFEMPPWLRQSLIAGHTFYVEQARKRLLPQFQDMKAEADTAAEQWLEQNSRRFDPDFHDNSDFYQWAEEAGIKFYELLSDMKEQTSLGIVAGLFHAWDKRLRHWLMQQIGHWHTGDCIKRAVWNANFDKTADLLTALGWNLANTTYWRKLDECRLVVNAYKHGEGTALNELNAKHPEYFVDPFGSRKVRQMFGNGLLDYTQLRITDEQIQSFADAIVAFWQAVPEKITDRDGLEPPVWFAKAMEKDTGAADHQGPSQ